MGVMAIQQMADRLAELLEDRLRIRGKGLDGKLARTGRQVPRNIRAALVRVAEAATMAQNPKLYLQIDHEQVAADYDLALRHLNALDRWDRRKGALLSWLTSTLFAMIVLGGLVVAVLRWRGFL